MICRQAGNLTLIRSRSQNNLASIGHGNLGHLFDFGHHRHQPSVYFRDLGQFGFEDGRLGEIRYRCFDHCTGVFAQSGPKTLIQHICL